MPPRVRAAPPASSSQDTFKCQKFLQSLLKVSVSNDPDMFVTNLNDGVILCDLLNAIEPGTVAKKEIKRDGG